MGFRVVKQEFWKDEKVLELFSAEDKYFFLFLLTNSCANQLGVYKLPIKLMSFELGYSKEQVIVLIDRFINYGMIRYNLDTQEVAIANYLFHSIVKGGKPVMDAIHKDLSKVTDLTLLSFVYDRVSSKPIDPSKQTLIQVLSDIKDILIINNIYKDNDNDDSLTIRTTIRDESDYLDELEENFEKIYSIYPKKIGKADAFKRYRQWISKSGRKVNGRYVKLTNKQIWLAVKKYVTQLESRDTDLQYYKGFDVLMGDSLLDYIDK